jgi:hypothetical protein
MEVREKLEDVLKGLSLTDEERLGAFSSFANKHRKRVVQTVDEMSQMLRATLRVCSAIFTSKISR